MSIFNKLKKENYDYISIKNPSSERDKQILKDFNALNDYKQLNNISEFTPIKTAKLPIGEYFVLYNCVGYMLYTFDENTPLENSFINFREKNKLGINDFTDISNGSEDALYYEDLEETIPDGLRDFQMLIVTKDSIKFVNKYKVTLQKIINNTINALKNMSVKAQKSNIDIVSNQYTLFGDIINQAYYFCYTDIIHNLLEEKTIPTKLNKNKPEACLVPKNNKYDINKISSILENIVKDKDTLALDAFCKKYEPLSTELMPKHIKPEVKVKEEEKKTDDIEKQKLVQLKQLSNQEKLKKLNIFDENFKTNIEPDKKNQTMQNNINVILDSKKRQSELDDLNTNAINDNVSKTDNSDATDTQGFDDLLGNFNIDDLNIPENEQKSNESNHKVKQAEEIKENINIPYSKLSPIERIQKQLADKQYTIPQEETNNSSEIFDHSSDIQQANKKPNKPNKKN